MKIYLAAQFSEQQLMKGWREALRFHGHVVTSRWLDVTETDLTTSRPQTEAEKDLEDISEADIVLSKTLNRGELFTGGGRHIEFGYAYAKGKDLINVGGYESVFHKLPQVLTVKTIQEAIEYINGKAAL